MTLLPAGAYAIELHPPTRGNGISGSCFTGWDTNAHSEWGSWALAIGVHHACVARPRASPHRCYQDFHIDYMNQAPLFREFEVDVTTAALLVSDVVGWLRPAA